jgi:hypothetical protein
MFCLDIYHHLINPIVNPADILPVRGISKLVIANEEAAAVSALVNQQKMKYQGTPKHEIW